MKEEEMKIKAGKPYEELTTEEKALIVDFTEEEHTELKLKYGKRLKHVTVQVDEDERYDYLIVRPKKNILLARAKKKDDLEEANDILIRNCVAAGNMEALEDSTVYTSVLTAIGQLIAGQAAFIAKHRGIFKIVQSCRGNRCHPEKSIWLRHPGQTGRR